MSSDSDRFPEPEQITWKRTGFLVMEIFGVTFLLLGGGLLVRGRVDLTIPLLGIGTVLFVAGHRLFNRSVRKELMDEQGDAG